MKRWKSAGLWLAVFVCAGLAGWGGRQWEAGKTGGGAQDAATPSATPARARVHMPISLAPGRVSTTRFPLTREAAQRAARAGVLRVALADGTYYDVTIARASEDAQGHWSIAGHALTRLGPQSMVLTYGQRAVFGTLPLPDGRVLQVRTEHGRALIGDHVGFRQRRAAEQQAGGDLAPQGTPPQTESTAPDASRLVGDTIDITVLGLYTDDLLALREGDVDAIATEFASMLAIANQAHIDSASVVRFANAGLRAVGTDFADNATALDALAATPGVREARDAAGADLVTLLRPRGKTDTGCGNAFRAADGMARNKVTDADGFAVANVAPCGPYTLAHELGHALGNAHDRESELRETGELRHGAYRFSFAHKTRTFATLDAEAGDLPVVGRFSNPLQTDCNGEACGIDDVADNVRSMQLMAAEVAQYRGTPGTISIADAVAYEPANGRNVSILVPIRLTGAITDETVTVEVVGGSATAFEDYHGLQQPLFNIGASEAFVVVTLRGDDIAEGTEAIVLRIAGVDTSGTTTIEKDTATLTILDEPREMLYGRVRSGNAPLHGDVELIAHGADGNGGGNAGDILFYRAEAPDYSFAIPVLRGASVRLELPEADDVYTAPVWVNDIRDDRYAELTVDHTVPVLIRYPAGLDGSVLWTRTIGTLPPVSSFTSTAGNTGVQFNVPPGARVRVDVETTEGSQGLVFDDVRAPIDHGAVLSTTPSVYVDAPRRSTREGRAGDSRIANFIVRLSRASAERATVHYRTVDGTAKAGVDYVGVEGDLIFEPGQTFLEIPVTLLGDNTREYPESFALLIEDASGALPTSARLEMAIADDDHATGGPLPADAH